MASGEGHVRNGKVPEAEAYLKLKEEFRTLRFSEGAVSWHKSWTWPGRKSASRSAFSGDEDGGS